MEVQEIGAFKMIELPPDPQADMIRRQIEFQKLVGGYDARLKDFAPLGGGTYCLPNRTLHHLDMAVQECSEAWDMLEGGWKHHKRKPSTVDRTELLMEVVDVAHFLINAYIFMGGQPEREMVAASVGRDRTQLKVPSIDLEYTWRLGTRSFDGKIEAIEPLYGHGAGAHGPAWVKRSATAVNYLRSKIFFVTETMREGLSSMSRAQRQPEKFPPSSGFVYIETFPWLFAAAQTIPDCTPQEFYSAFIHKNDVNLARQSKGY